MKLKLFTLIFFLSIFALNLNAQLLFQENFSYTAGDSIGSHGWTAISGTVNNILVVSPGLTYTGYPSSAIGNAARLANNGLDNSKIFTADSITSGSVYASFMVKIDSAKSGGDYFFTLTPPSNNTSFDPRVYVKDSAGTLSFGTSKGPNAATPTYGANGFSYGTTYLVVVRYQFMPDSSANDKLYLYVFTSPNVPATEPSTPYVGPFTSTTADQPGIGRVVLRQGSTSTSPSLTIDGIRIAKSWSSIVNSVNNISNNIPDKFSLSQNYPNPFNPVTNIRFEIPLNGFVKMKVYDLLGKEVSNLVNQNLTAGVYEAKFDASALTSGIYFYSINYVNSEGNIFSDTKKLMLIK